MEITSHLLTVLLVKFLVSFVRCPHLGSCLVLFCCCVNFEFRAFPGHRYSTLGGGTPPSKSLFTPICPDSMSVEHSVQYSSTAQEICT